MVNKRELSRKLLTILFPLGISLYVSFCITILCGRFCCSFLTKKHAEVDNRYIYYSNLFISSGWSHAWHFDESPFSTTIMLQTAEDGGYFDYTRPIRGGRGGGDKNNKKVRCFMKKIVFENGPKKSHI